MVVRMERQEMVDLEEEEASSAHSYGAGGGGYVGGDGSYKAFSGGGVVVLLEIMAVQYHLDFTLILGSHSNSFGKGFSLYEFDYQHTFTNCGATGYQGPTLAQMRSTYSGTSWVIIQHFLTQLNKVINYGLFPNRTIYYRYSGTEGGRPTSTF